METISILAHLILGGYLHRVHTTRQFRGKHTLACCKGGANTGSAGPDLPGGGQQSGCARLRGGLGRSSVCARDVRHPCASEMSHWAACPVLPPHCRLAAERLNVHGRHQDRATMLNSLITTPNAYSKGTACSFPLLCVSHCGTQCCSLKQYQDQTVPSGWEQGKQ